MRNPRLSKHHAFELLHLSVLRECLIIGFGFNRGADSASDEANERDFERIVNDFVFLSMFAGNDFNPHSPTVGSRCCSTCGGVGARRVHPHGDAHRRGEPQGPVNAPG